MNSFLQQILLAVYRGVAKTGILNTRPGRAVFEMCYQAYKSVLEAGPIENLKEYVRPNTTVIVVGANVGFITLRFARWVSGTGRVIAIEPEALNCQRLCQSLKRKALSGVVDVVEAVAAENDGMRHLEINPYHPGDHKISERGIQVPAVTLDGLLSKRETPPVSLIKIDVQGGELAVLLGAQEVLKRNNPVLFVEIDDACLRRFGSSAEMLLRLIEDNGYEFHKLRKNGPGPKLSFAETLTLVTGDDSYHDVLMLPRSRVPD